MFKSLVILFALLFLSAAANGRNDYKLAKSAIEFTSSDKAELIHYPIPTDVEKDTTKKWKRKKKERTEEQKEKIRKRGFIAHIFFTILAAFSFVLWLSLYRSYGEPQGCLEVAMKAWLLYYVYASGIAFGVLTLTLIMHIIIRHIQKKA